jgi:ABC-2 type transport system permease protein
VSEHTRTPLPVGAELGRQLRRRRTQWLAALVVALPLLLVGAFALGSDDGGGGSSLVDLATSSAGNFATFTLFACTGFLLVVLVALLAGDTVAAEASWSSLRYLLAAPVARSRLLRVKLGVALLTAAAGLVALVVVALLIGLAFYGWHPVTTPQGGTLAAWTVVGRLAIAVVEVATSLLWVAGVAFWLSTRTDAPLGAVGGAVLAFILSSILDSVTALGDLRVWLPTHDQYAWVGALAATPQWDATLRGTCVSLSYAVVALVAAWRGFGRKDITS